MSDIHMVQFAMRDGIDPKEILAMLTGPAERCGWVFSERQKREFSGDRKRPSSVFDWGKAQSTQYMALSFLNAEHFPNPVLEVSLNNTYFARSSWFSEERREREEARAFSGKLIQFLLRLIEATSPDYGLGDTDFAFSDTQLTTTVLPPRDRLIGVLEKKRHKPWLVYFGPELIRELGKKRIDQLGGTEHHEVAGGILLVFRKNPSTPAE